MTYRIPVPNSAQLHSASLDLRVAIDAELRRLDWHWKHPRIQDWLYRVSQVTDRPVTMVCDLSDRELQCLLTNLQKEPKQLQLGDNHA